jgi:hypothetical protein
MPRLFVELTSNPIRWICYAILLLGGLGGGCWMFGPEVRPVYMHPTTSKAIETACNNMLAALPSQPVAFGPTLVLTFANDPVDNNQRELVTEALRQALEKGGYRLVEKSRTDRLREWAANQINISALKPGPVRDAETALKYAAWAEAKFVVFGEVVRLQQPIAESKDQQALVEFRAQMFLVESGMSVLDGTFNSKADVEPEPPLNRLATAPTQPWYGAGLAFFAMVWPLALTSLMRRVVRTENNQLTLFALLVIIAVPVALGWPWAFGANASVWRSIFFLIGAALVALWCTFVMSRVAEMNKY